MKVMWSSKAKSVVDDCRHCDRKCVRVRVRDRKCDRCVDQEAAQPSAEERRQRVDAMVARQDWERSRARRSKAAK